MNVNIKSKNQNKTKLRNNSTNSYMLLYNTKKILIYS